MAGAAPQPTVRGRAPGIQQHHSNADPNTVAVGAVSLRERDGGMEGEVKAKKKKPHELGHVLHGTMAPVSGSARTPRGPAVHTPEIAATFCVKELVSFFFLNIFSVFFLGTTIKRAVLHSHIPDCTAAVSSLRRAAAVPRAEAHARAKPGWGTREDAAPTALSLLGTRRGGKGTPNPEGPSVSLQTIQTLSHPPHPPLLFPLFHPNAAK